MKSAKEKAQIKIPCTTQISCKTTNQQHTDQSQLKSGRNAI